MKNAAKTNAKKAAALAAATEAAREALLIETLETRGRDALDFHEVSVSMIRDAIAIAFEAGYAAGQNAAAK
ncbi:MAG: hypothetical protein JSR77_04465 [Planctomycetes bacterium]|nr:hypothetical protein [Planctomycetota bacterium]